MNSTSEIAESARVVLASLPADFVESGTVGTPEGRQEFVDACERLVASAPGEPPEQSEVRSLQQAGRTTSYIEVPDEEDEMPSGGDPLNDYSLFDPEDEDTGYDPLFDGHAAYGATVFNTAAGTVPMPVVGSFNELLGR